MPRVIIHDDSGRREVALDGDHISVGRLSNSNDVVISNPDVSGNHCRFSSEGSTWFIEDLDSSNGTKVNGRKVGRFELADGDEIHIGGVKVEYLESDATSSATVPDIDLGADLDLDMELEISLEEEAWLFFPEQDGRIDVVIGRTTLGRASTNTLQLRSAGVSSQHAEIVSSEGEWTFRDVGSTNGSQVNGVSVSECCIDHGAHIKIGDEKIIFGLGDQSRVAEFGIDRTDTDEGMGDAVFQLSGENVPKGQGLQFVMWLALFAGIGVGGWFLIQGQAGQSRSSSNTPLVVAGNLVEAGASFELTDSDVDTIESASDSLDFEETTARASTGRFSLQVKASGAEGEHTIDFTNAIDHISAADRLRIGASFRTMGFSGCIGVLLSFENENGEAIGKACVNAPEGLSEFTTVEGVFKAPFGTSRARLSIATHGANGRAWVDDIYVTRLRGDERREIRTGAYGSDVAESGILSVAGEGSELLSDMGLYRRGRRGAESIHDYFVASDWSRSATAITCSGMIVDTGDLEGMALDIDVAGTDNGLTLRASVPKIPAGVFYGVGVNPDDPITAVSGAGVARLSDVFDLAEVSQLIVGVDNRAARLTFSSPLRVARSRQNQDVVCLYAPPSDGGAASWEMSIQLDFESEMEEAMGLFQAAEENRNKDRLLGAAVNRFNEICNRFPFYSDIVKRSSAIASSLQAEGESAAQTIEDTGADIVFFGTYRINGHQFLQNARTESAVWAGTPIGDRVSAVLANVEAEQRKLSGARLLAQARNHLLRGNDLMVKGRERPVLARGFYSSVILLAPGTAEATEAAENLKRIAMLEGEGN